MEKKKILIVDDDPDIVKKWCEELGEIESIKYEFEPVPLKFNDFKEALSLLEKRRRAARKTDYENIPFSEYESCIIDQSEILIVDYDLLDFDETGDDHIAGVSTGERVAYLARSYSTCGLIVALNQFGDNRFDLTLKGNVDSYADINLGSKQLNNVQLWQISNPEGFRPWSWFILPQAAKAHRMRCEILLAPNNDGSGKTNLETPILKFLNFDETSLPRQTAEFLGTNNLTELTFKEFVLESHQGFNRKDKPLNDVAIANMAAARISKWIERSILPGQEILVDAPHLISRFPSLLKGEVKDINLWNSTALLDSADELPLKNEFLNEFKFDSNWLSRPAWFWEKLKNNENIDEIKDPFSAYQKQSEIDYVFCEDLSRFLPMSGTKSFVADLPSPFVRRFVVDDETEIGNEFKKYVEDVKYEPTVRFML